MGGAASSSTGTEQTKNNGNNLHLVGAQSNKKPSDKSNVNVFQEQHPLILPPNKRCTIPASDGIQEIVNEIASANSDQKLVKFQDDITKLICPDSFKKQAISTTGVMVSTRIKSKREVPQTNANRFEAPENAMKRAEVVFLIHKDFNNLVNMDAIQIILTEFFNCFTLDEEIQKYLIDSMILSLRDNLKYDCMNFSELKIFLLSVYCNVIALNIPKKSDDDSSSLIETC
jgi:hypothetical protein